MFHNHSQKEIIQKFVSIDTTFLDLFGPNNNRNVKFGAVNISSPNTMIQQDYSSTNAAILTKNYSDDTKLTTLVEGIKNRKKNNSNKSKVFKVCASDFMIHLPETLTKVIQMKVCAIDLPHPMFNISPFYKNNYVKIIETTTPDQALPPTAEIELPSGNYTTEELIMVLNDAINFINSDIKSRFFYNPILGKVFLSYTDHVAEQVGGTEEPGEHDTLTEELPAVPVPVPEQDPTVFNVSLHFSTDSESCYGPKKYMSLGTVLGFRKSEYIYDNDYMNLHDSNNVMVHNGANQYDNETCMWPEYPKNSSSSVPIIQKPNEYYNPQGFIAEASPTDNASSYLWLVIDDFVKEQKTDYMVVSTNRSEINSSKLYCKIPIKNGKVTFDTSYFLDDYKREYFNPTNIDKLQIKLLEPSGIVTYFSQSNFNMDIQFSCLR
jgi:hypothetical protein